MSFVSPLVTTRSIKVFDGGTHNDTRQFWRLLRQLRIINAQLRRSRFKLIVQSCLRRSAVAA